MLRKRIINSIFKQGDTDKAFENEALATFIEGEVTNRLINLLTEQDIQSLENLRDEDIISYLRTKVSGLNDLIIEEVKKAKEKFQIKKRLAV